MWGGPDELVEILRSTPVILRQLMHGVDDERARRRSAGEDDWSVVEVVAHLVDVEERAIGRITRIMTEDEPVLERINPVALAEERGYRAMALAETLDRFERLRAERLIALTGLDAPAWGRTGRVGSIGVLSLQALTTHMCQHDVVHLAQIARLVAGA